MRKHGYVGQTARKFSQRIGEHRRCYEKCFGKIIDNSASDEYALRLHVQQHHKEALHLPMAEVFVVSYLQNLQNVSDLHVAEDRWAGRLLPGINKQNMVTRMYK